MLLAACGGSSDGESTNQAAHGIYEVDGTAVRLVSQLAGVREPEQAGAPAGTTWKLSLHIGISRADQPVALVVEAPLEDAWAPSEAEGQQLMRSRTVEACTSGAVLAMRVTTGETPTNWSVMYVSGDTAVLAPAAQAETCEEVLEASPAFSDWLRISARAPESCLLANQVGGLPLALPCALRTTAGSVQQTTSGRTVDIGPLRDDIRAGISDGSLQGPLLELLSPPTTSSAPPFDLDSVEVTTVARSLDAETRLELADALLGFCRPGVCERWRLRLLGQLLRGTKGASCDKGWALMQGELSASDDTIAAARAVEIAADLTACGEPELITESLRMALGRPSAPEILMPPPAKRPYATVAPLCHAMPMRKGWQRGGQVQCLELPRLAGEWLSRNCDEETVDEAVRLLQKKESAKLDPRVDATVDGVLRVLHRCDSERFTELTALARRPYPNGALRALYEQSP